MATTPKKTTKPAPTPVAPETADAQEQSVAVPATEAAAESKPAAQAAERSKSKDEQTAESLWVRTVPGHARRLRAGHVFGRDWQCVDCSQLSADQEKFLHADKKLEVTDKEPEAVKAAQADSE